MISSEEVQTRILAHLYEVDEELQCQRRACTVNHERVNELLQAKSTALLALSNTIIIVKEV